jgi:hypothetical protein
VRDISDVALYTFVIPTNYAQGTCFCALHSTTYMRVSTSDTTTLPAIISSVIFQEVDYFENSAISTSSLSDSYLNSRPGKWQ